MKQKPQNSMKTVALYVFFLILLLTTFSNFSPRNRDENMKYSTFVETLRNKIDGQKITSIKIGEREVTGNMEKEVPFDSNKTIRTPFKVVIPNDPGLMEIIRDSGVVVEVEPPEQMSWWLNLLINWFPFILLIGAWLCILQKMQGGGARAMSFGKSRAKVVDPTDKRILFKDVAGVNEAKEDLVEIVDFLREPRKFTDLGAKIPRGVLLFGPPGTGKTLLARAVAGEANVAFFNISGSEFVEMFVGVGASRVRDLFEQARKNYPCIIFMDEIDAVGRHRGAGLGGGHDEREQTLNQLLVEMDGFDTKDGVIILAATNRPDVLDPALLRPGRFDRQVVVAMPDIREREAILRIHASKIPLDSTVDLQRFARATPGMSGADLANLVNEAALYAARKDKETVESPDFEEARDKILMGVARKSMVMPEKDRRMTAVHESGHALLHYYLKNADPLHKVTIIPRGQALGLAVSLPESDAYSRTRGWLRDRICINFGGYVAEKLVYGETTTGTKADLQQATDIARRMACEYGMADDLGTVTYGQEDEPIFLGKEIARHKDYSEDTARRIDTAVKAILDEARLEAERIITGHRAELDRLTDALLIQETLDDAEIRAMISAATTTATDNGTEESHA